MILQTGYIIVGDNLEYLLAFLNSKLIEWAFRRFYSIELGNTGLRWLKQYVENLPIPVPTKVSAEAQKLFRKLFDKQIKNSTPEIDNEINNFIYTLYNLSDKEIKFIESYF